LRRSLETLNWRVAAPVLAVGLLVACGAPVEQGQIDAVPASQPRTSGSEPESPRKLDDSAATTSTLSEADAMDAIDAATNSPPTIVAQDDEILLPSGESWRFTVRVAWSPNHAVCLENVGSWQACRALPERADEPQILGYGGAPIPVFVAGSTGDFDTVTAVLLDGSTATALFVQTEAGAYAALPFSAKNPPVKAFATSPSMGEVDLGVDEYVGDDYEATVEGAIY
jgi:hypothetical protein